MGKQNDLKSMAENKGGEYKNDGRIGYINSLDGLRGVTICMIAFLWHFWMFQPENGYPFGNIFVFSYNYGYLGVEIFFMISGFVMAYNYQDKIAEGEISFNKYFFKRVKHLWLINFVTLLLVTVEHFIYSRYTGTTYVASNFDLWHFILNVFLLQYGITEIPYQYSYNVPAWCLTIELVCYIIYFVIIRSDQNKGYWLMKCMSCVLIGLVVLNQRLEYPIINFEMARGITSYFIGVVLCEMYKRYHKNKSSLTNMGIYIYLLISYIAFRKFGTGWMGENIYLAILCFAPAIIWITVNSTLVNKVLSIKPIVFLGRISLYIYLLHFPVQYFIKIIDVMFDLKIRYSSCLFIILYSFGTILISAIAYGFYSKVNNVWIAKRVKE